jgi:D-alanyl-lipoteichoic acid acyltransferase DltB (MBOAT superfamily)
MLFNSAEFIFAFLPVTLLGCFLLARLSKGMALAWLTFASLVFYAWWRPQNVLIILPAILVNYVLARWLMALRGNESKRALARAILVAGILGNVAFLGYFKYANFVESTLNDYAGTHFVLTQVILPLGISFITFQKIAFLIDVHAGRVESFSLREFFVFVLFFPQLVAGPIVHFREMVPQFRTASIRFELNHVAVGLTLFALGLFKKVVLADGIAGYVSPIYAQSQTEHVSLFPAWIAAIGFTLQIYFDFSAYSDMATGLARCVGIRLPLNFDSPLKASSIVDFWLRWHVTLTRFLTAYIYNPLVLAQTRRRLKKGLPGLTNRGVRPGAFLQLLAGPTLLTMLISGIWHGAGFLFIAWGLVHGVYICVNHAWRMFVVQRLRDKERCARAMKLPGFVLTFLCVVAAMVLFRSPTAGVAADLLAGMVGLHGISVPRALVEPFGLVPLLEPFVQLAAGGATDLVMGGAWVAALLLIALLLPNSLQMLAKYEPVVGTAPRKIASPWVAGALSWRPGFAWTVALCGLTVAAVLRLGGPSEFLYWQF